MSSCAMSWATSSRFSDKVILPQSCSLAKYHIPSCSDILTQCLTLSSFSSNTAKRRPTSSQEFYENDSTEDDRCGILGDTTAPRHSAAGQRRLYTVHTLVEAMPKLLLTLKPIQRIRSHHWKYLLEQACYYTVLTKGNDIIVCRGCAW